MDRCVSDVRDFRDWMEIEEFGRIKFLTGPRYFLGYAIKIGEAKLEAKRSNGNENLQDEHKSENGDVGNLKEKKKKKLLDNPFVSLILRRRK